MGLAARPDDMRRQGISPQSARLGSALNGNFVSSFGNFVSSVAIDLRVLRCSRNVLGKHGGDRLAVCKEILPSSLLIPAHPPNKCLVLRMPAILVRLMKPEDLNDFLLAQLVKGAAQGANPANVRAADCFGHVVFVGAFWIGAGQYLLERHRF
jgi:hypothetical protein